MISHTVFGCPACGRALTKPLRPVPPGLGSDRVCTVVPWGCWEARPDPVYRPNAPIVIVPGDLISLVRHPDRRRSMGCCGPGFADGLPNILCPGCAAEVGFASQDGNHAPWMVSLPDCRVDHLDLRGLSDSVVSRRAAAFVWHEGLPLEMSPDIPDVGPDDTDLWELPEVDFGWVDGLTVDGRPVRPVWPLDEVRRWVGLGRLPHGTFDEPVRLYAQEGDAYEEWWMVVDDGELFLCGSRLDPWSAWWGRGPIASLEASLRR